MSPQLSLMINEPPLDLDAAILLHQNGYQCTTLDDNGNLVTDYFDADGVFLSSTSSDKWRMPEDLSESEMAYALEIF